MLFVLRTSSKTEKMKVPSNFRHRLLFSYTNIHYLKKCFLLTYFLFFFVWCYKFIHYLFFKQYFMLATFPTSQISIKFRPEKGNFLLLLLHTQFTFQINSLCYLSVDSGTQCQKQKCRNDGI